MEDLISVIIPAYKSQNTITNTLFSILNQEFKNIEIIVVVDGLNDSTFEVVSNIKDERIKLFKKENNGVVSAYKYGIKQAKGNYIMFCDSDDSYRPGYIYKAYDLIKNKNCDFVSFAYNVVDKNNQIKETVRNTLDTGFYDKDFIQKNVIPKVIFNSFKREQMFIVLVLRWNKIYTKELINSFLEKLDEKCKQIEDNFFTTNVLLNAKSFYICNDFFCYDYLIGDESISSGYKDLDMLEKYLYSIKKIEDVTKDIKTIDPHQLDFLIYDNARIVFRRCAKYSTFRNAYKLLLKIRRNENIKRVRFNDLSMMKNKIFYIGLKFHLFIMLYFIFKK